MTMMHSKPHIHVVVPLVILSAAAIAGAQSASCFKDLPMGSACNIGLCDTSENCSQIPPNTVIDEEVTVTQLPGDRKLSTPIGFLCFKTFTKENDDGYCNIPWFCQAVVNGSRANGGRCMQGGPF